MAKPPKNSRGQVPTSSSGNRFANKRTAFIAATILVIVLLVILIPW